jgi:hypothetical protein
MLSTDLELFCEFLPNASQEQIDEIKKWVAQEDKESYVARDFGISGEKPYPYLRKQRWFINKAIAETF